MIEISEARAVSLRWVVENNDRLDFYASIPNGPGATALRQQYLLISGNARMCLPLHAGHKLAGSHKWAAKAKQLNREYSRGVFYRYRSDRGRDHPEDAQIVMFQQPLIIPPSGSSAKEARSIHGALYTAAAGGTRWLAAALRVRPWADRFGREPIWLDYARLMGMVGMPPVDLGITPPFAYDHDPAFRDLQSDPTDTTVINCITTGWASLPLIKPWDDWWNHEALLPFVALRSVRDRLWRPMIDYLVGKKLSECIDMLVPIPTGPGDGDESEDDVTDATDGGTGGTTTPIIAGPCYAGRFSSLRFVGDRFMFEVRRVQSIQGAPHETVLWLLDFPEYGRALRVYRDRADAVAYARGVRTGVAAPLFRRVHTGDWAGATETFLAQYGAAV